MKQPHLMDETAEQVPQSSTSSHKSSTSIHQAESYVSDMDSLGNPFLKEFVQTVREEIEQEFLKRINTLYVDDLDIQQSFTLERHQMVAELDLYQRKLYLMIKGGIEISVPTINRMAFYFLIREFYNDGLELLTSCINQIQKNDVALNFLGLFYFRLGFLDKALETFQKLAHMNTPLQSWVYSVGIIYYMNEQYQKALDTLLPIKESQQSRGNYLLCIGNCYYYLNEDEHALRYLMPYLEKQPKNAKITKRVALLLYNLRRYQEAKPYFERLKGTDEQVEYMDFKWAVLYYYTNNLKNAAMKLVDMLNFDRSMITTIDKDFVFGLLLQAIEHRHFDRHVFYIIKEMLQEDVSETRLELVRKKSKVLNEMEAESSDQLQLRAFVNILLEQYAPAEKDLLQLIERGHQSADVLQDLCKVYFYQDKRAEGINLFEQLDRVDQLEGEIYFLVAESYYAQDMYQQAIHTLETALEKEYQTPNVYNLLGFCYFSLERYAEAIRAYKRLLELDPDDVDAMNDLGIAYSKMQHFEEAVQLFKNIIAREPENKDAHYNLNQVYRLILEKEAEDHYENYIELSKS
jgi:tetratricopeptide (TPR) repeat protein